MIGPLTSPPRIEPAGKPQTVTVTIVARLRCGAYSEASAIMLGITPPSPIPPSARHATSAPKPCANTASPLNTPNSKVAAIVSRARPKRSASAPNRLVPSTEPSNVALKI